MRNRLQMGATRASRAREDNPCYILKVRGERDTYLKPDGTIGTAGKGPLIQVEKSATLGTNQDQVLFVLNDHEHPPIVFGISSYASNAMKSDNPHSGIYEAQTSRTLDPNGGNPACNQGGMIVLAAIEGNGSRPSHRGVGMNDGKTMYTLNSTEVHGVITNDL